MIAYVGPMLSNDDGKPIFSNRLRHLTDWQGNRIGTCYISASWPVRSYIGSHMNQIRAYVTADATHYTGRGFGEGMAVNLRPCKKP
jgi:hypothetical protein